MCNLHSLRSAELKLSLHAQESLPERPRRDAESQLVPLGRITCGAWPPSYEEEEETRKARDAIIVAIGIASVLVINVTYLGYITTPGGPEPYWADCFYPTFVAYYVLNGFAMVFSLAALCTVTWGPFALILRVVSAWRTRVVNVGLFNLAISLASLLGAFACAGFVAASVGAPELSCGNLRCDEGGVSCNAFRTVPAAVRFHHHAESWQPWTYALDPVLAELNNATFADAMGRNVHGGPTITDVGGHGVVCHSYSFVAAKSDLGGITEEGCAPTCATHSVEVQGEGVLTEANGTPVNTTCFVLMDKATFVNSSLEQAEEVDAYAGNPSTFWCSLNGVGLGPGWLPLQWKTAEQLLLTSGPEYTLRDEFELYSNNISRDGYSVQGENSSSCPLLSGFEKLAKPLLPQPLDSAFNPRGIELLAHTPVETSAAWCEAQSDNSLSSGLAAAARHYALLLGGLSLDAFLGCRSRRASLRAALQAL